MKAFKERTGILKHTAVFHLFFCLLLLYFETLLHWIVFGEFTVHFLYKVGFTIAFAAVFAFILSLFPQKAFYWSGFAVTVLLLIIYGSQIIYYHVFGGLYSVAQAKLGGGAITSFWRELLVTIKENYPSLILLLLPTVLMLLFKKRLCGIMRSPGFIGSVSLALCAVFIYVITVFCLRIGGTGYYTNYYFYHSNTTTTEQAVNRFGLLSAMGLDLFADENPESEDYYLPEDETPETTQSLEDVNTAADESIPPQETTADETTAPTEPPEPEVTYNVLDIDFDSLNDLTEDKKILALNRYFEGLSGTNQNKYTGLLSDYNLIVICAESFSPATVDPVLTPTLYRLCNEGIIFNNFYNTYPNTTIDGEYTLCTGLYPDGSRSKWNSSFITSADNYMPFALGNIFASQRGIQSYGYHNYLGTYFDRVTSHPNLGYEMKFMEDGMKFSSSWPSSDLEMMEQSIGDYISSEPFHAYYMTFSGHYVYNKDTNYMAALNWKSVKDLDYSDTSKAYLACNLELEKAMTYLMEQLETAGVIDRTAIVICPDHFPYGLTDEQYSELIGYEIDDFSKFKSNLAFWVGGLEENIIVNEYCCNADILPTILNLWGFEFDSRLLAGTDVFSDGTHIAILRDYSFYTDKIWFNASTGEIRYLVDEDQIPANYLNRMNRLVNTKCNISVDILNTDYYRFLFDSPLPTEE